MVAEVMDSSWAQKPWSVTEEMWKRKAKGLEDQYQQLLSDHQDLRLDKAKIMGELRVLQRYKETADDMIGKEVATRKIEHKEKVSATTKLEQYMKKYERECERTQTLERENAFLVDQVSSMKGETEKRLDLLRELEETQKRNTRNKEKIREMEIVGIEHENTILELKERVQKLKRKLDSTDEALGDKTEECKNLAVRLAAVESAWEAARGQNKLALHELKKKESLTKELEVVKTESKDLRDANSQLKKELAKVTDKVQNLSSSVSVMEELLAEKDREIDRKDELIRCKKTEVKCLAKIDDSSKDRIEELVRQVADLQQQLLETQKEYLSKVKKDEVWREKQRARDRSEITKDLEVLHKPRRCKNCNETFTNKTNTSLSCSYHPGRYVARQYPLEGYQWSCCQKRDLSSPTLRTRLCTPPPSTLPAMRLVVKVHGLQFVMPCGDGSQSVKWLGLAVAQRYALAAPHGRCRTREDAHIKQGFFLPASVAKAGASSDLSPSQRIVDVCKDNDVLIVQLQQEVPVNEIGTPQFTPWTVSAFGNTNSQQQQPPRNKTAADAKAHTGSHSEDLHRAAEGKTGEIGPGAGRAPRKAVEDEMKEYARAELLQQVNSGQFQSETEVEAAFLYDWSRLRVDELERDPKERDAVQELLLAHFATLNTAFMHYAAGSGETAFGMSGDELAHFCHESGLCHYRTERRALEKVMAQCLKHDALASPYDRGTLSRVGFLHALLRMVQLQSRDNNGGATGFRDALEKCLQSNVGPAVTRLTSGPFRDHSHHDNGGSVPRSKTQAAQAVRQVRFARPAACVGDIRFDDLAAAALGGRAQAHAVRRRDVQCRRRAAPRRALRGRGRAELQRPARDEAARGPAARLRRVPRGVGARGARCARRQRPPAARRHQDRARRAALPPAQTCSDSGSDARQSTQSAAVGKGDDQPAAQVSRRRDALDAADRLQLVVHLACVPKNVAVHDVELPQLHAAVLHAREPAAEHRRETLALPAREVPLHVELAVVLADRALHERAPALGAVVRVRVHAPDAAALEADLEPVRLARPVLGRPDLIAEHDGRVCVLREAHFGAVQREVEALPRLEEPRLHAHPASVVRARSLHVRRLDRRRGARVRRAVVRERAG
ncbi:hypothetical protein PybrP1_007340 [[Pythium] brassicae (nom. inval.)]|nr:hypothetical protein PybrP1_007340 [[Pythium] brassicae (nom. inval.)]